MASTLTADGWVVRDDVVDERQPLPRLTQAEIDAINAEIAAGSNNYPTGTQVIRSSDETVFQKYGVGTAARFVQVASGTDVAAAIAAIEAQEEASAAVIAAAAVFTQAGTGAVARTFQNKARETEVSVMDFGATGDGVADDTAEILAAATAAAGKRLVFPSGTYLVTSATALQSNTDVYLEPGAHITTATANISIFTATNKSKVRVHGVGKLSQTVAGANASVAGVYFTGCTDCTVEGLEFEGFQWAGVYILNSHRCRVSGTYMHDWLGSVDNSAGVVIYQDSNDNVAEGNHFDATGWVGAYVQDPGGVGTYNPQRNAIRNNRIENTTAYGAMVYNGASGNSFNEITGNRISGVDGTAGAGQYGTGVYCVGEGLGGLKVLNNTVENCCINTTVTTLGPAGIRVGGNAVGTIKPVISENTVSGMTQGHGVLVITCPGGAVVGPNTVLMPSTNNGAGPGGASLAGVALKIHDSSDVTVSPGDYVHNGTSGAIQVLASTLSITGITLHVGNARTASAACVAISRSSSYTITGMIYGGRAECPADGTNALQATAFSGSVIGGKWKVGATAAASTAIAMASCTDLLFSGGVQAESTGTYSVSLSSACTGRWDKNNRFNGRFNNSSAGFHVEFLVTSIPTVGVFQIGDRAENITGTSGVAKGWRRITAGSAHVLATDWISEGNL